MDTARTSEVRLQFVTERTIGSALIRWFTAGPISHVDAMLPSGRLFGARWDRAGGCPQGVWPRPPDYHRFTRKVIATIAATPAQRTAWLDFLRQQKGKPYDWRAIVGFAFNRDWREDDSWDCSSLQARAIEVAGICPPLYLATNKITPAALALAISAMPNAHLEELP